MVTSQTNVSIRVSSRHFWPSELLLGRSHPVLSEAAPNFLSGPCILHFWNSTLHLQLLEIWDFLHWHRLLPRPSVNSWHIVFLLGRMHIRNCFDVLPLNHFSTSNLNISGFDFLEIIMDYLLLIVQLTEMHRHLSIDFLRTQIWNLQWLLLVKFIDDMVSVLILLVFKGLPGLIWIQILNVFISLSLVFQLFEIFKRWLPFLDLAIFVRGVGVASESVLGDRHLERAIS